jgi:hypothetical protein
MFWRYCVNITIDLVTPLLMRLLRRSNKQMPILATQSRGQAWFGDADSRVNSVRETQWRSQIRMHELHGGVPCLLPICCASSPQPTPRRIPIQHSVTPFRPWLSEVGSALLERCSGDAKMVMGCTAVQTCPKRQALGELLAGSLALKVTIPEVCAYHVCKLVGSCNVITVPYVYL